MKHYCVAMARVIFIQLVGLAAVVLLVLLRPVLRLDAQSVAVVGTALFCSTVGWQIAHEHCCHKGHR